MKSIEVKDVIVGDYLYVGGESGFCGGGYEKIVEIKTKYNEDTGEQYKVFITEEDFWWSDKGERIKGPKRYSGYGFWRETVEDKLEKTTEKDTIIKMTTEDIVNFTNNSDIKAMNKIMFFVTNCYHDDVERLIYNSFDKNLANNIYNKYLELLEFSHLAFIELYFDVDSECKKKICQYILNHYDSEPKIIKD